MHLWLQHGGEWAALFCTTPALALGEATPRLLERGLAELKAAELQSRVVLARCSPGSRSEQWLLIAGARVEASVNGLPLLAGLRLLEERDEIRLEGAGVFFFSTERPAEIEPFPGGDAQVFCPRCRLAIDETTPAVRCPGCALSYHQSEDYPCWTYSDACAACAWPTALDAGFRWTPEDL